MGITLIQNSADGTKLKEPVLENPMWEYSIYFKWKSWCWRQSTAAKICFQNKSLGFCNTKFSGILMWNNTDHLKALWKDIHEWEELKKFLKPHEFIIFSISKIIALYQTSWKMNLQLTPFFGSGSLSQLQCVYLPLYLLSSTGLFIKFMSPLIKFSSLLQSEKHKQKIFHCSLRKPNQQKAPAIAYQKS